MSFASNIELALDQAAYKEIFLASLKDETQPLILCPVLERSLSRLKNRIL